MLQTLCPIGIGGFLQSIIANSCSIQQAGVGRLSPSCLVLCLTFLAEALRVVCLAAGFHYAKSLSQKAQMALGLATDPSDMLNEMIQVQ